MHQLIPIAIDLKISDLYTITYSLSLSLSINDRELPKESDVRSLFSASSRSSLSDLCLSNLRPFLLVRHSSVIAVPAMIRQTPPTTMTMVATVLPLGPVLSEEKVGGAVLG